MKELIRLYNWAKYQYEMYKEFEAEESNNEGTVKWTAKMLAYYDIMEEIKDSVLNEVIKDENNWLS